MTQPNHLAESASTPRVQTFAVVNWQNLAVSAQFRPTALARLCGLSVRTVQRHFKKTYGMTLGDWLRSYRLQLAYDRLRAGEAIKCVAIDLGYKQLSHFSRDFKKGFGCPPRFLKFQPSASEDGLLEE